MAIVLGKAPKTITDNLTYMEPTENLNGKVKRQAKITIKKLPQSEWKTLMGNVTDDKELCKAMIEDMEIQGPDGNKVDYSPEVLDQLWEWDYISTAIVQKVYETGNLMVGKALALKNS